MPQIKPYAAALALAVLFALAGCGDSNPQAVFSPESGHPAGWATSHTGAGTAHLDSCFSCHGENLDGGISRVSCTSCHLGSPSALHPIQWGSFAYARHAAYVAGNGTASCAIAACHGESLQGGAGSAPDCATRCHLGGADRKHPADWTSISSHKGYVEANGTASCKTSVCHGTDGKGVFLSGPACDQCHSMK